ncbi:probable protein phosphatase 2C 73 [Punica granatum]|uniref:PPM-type phosphatase domain-containing protein n=2 Tax=Punica granatum TaxID=22663 RepID=A0A218X9N7_PUNGR|nr:probable protein phosphatase 2C 73 [Punica granatum]OWM81667.1 hypothetical protein CDL15_Pgr007705 [Punica granatum]PKI34137.1 hypothetical protein CRG98_045492 [Punica granatum]
MGACCSKNIDDFGYEDIEPEEWETDGEDVLGEGDCGAKIRLKGSSSFVSVFSKQGKKGVNQDALTVWEEFTGEKDVLYCSVFDGHGPSGHEVAHRVRDKLPSKLSSAIKRSQVKASNIDLMDKDDSEEEEKEEDDGRSGNSTNSRDEDSTNSSLLLSSWEASFIRSFKDMDDDLKNDSTVDCFCSGTTAVSIVRLGDHLMVANLGDSRAVLCTRGQKNQLVPVQLTVDLKPNIPSEVERIRKCKGRVFAIEHEPEVFRIWMPDENCPGLAMARAFGDFCLKDYGLISQPDLSYRKIMPSDEFVVLATDGIWDVLTNNEVIKVVSSVRTRSLAAKVLVARAVRAWRTKYPGYKIDDCAVICLFFKEAEPSEQPELNAPKGQSGQGAPNPPGPAKGKKNVSPAAGKKEKDNEEWNALEGVTRVNSLIKLPRLSSILHRRKAAKDHGDASETRSIADETRSIADEARSISVLQ